MPRQQFSVHFFSWIYKTSFVLMPAFLLGLLVFHSCKKTDVASSSGTGSGTPGSIVTSLPASVTPVGQPVGTPVSKIIGPAGGSLVSANGVVEIKIPAGALATNTTISIQPVMNEMPGSVDTLAYDLLPNGTKFSVPATITFHYTSDQEPDNHPEFMFVAYQDSTGAWVADTKQRDYDSTAKTVSLDISHFTIWNFGDEFTLGEHFKIHGTPLTLHSLQTSIITVNENYSEDAHGTSKIIQDNPLDGKYLTDWSVGSIPSGNSYFGHITPYQSQAIYLAPSNIISTYNVVVTVHINIKLTLYKKGKAVKEIDGFTKSLSIKLEPYHTYMLTVTLKYVDSAVCTLDPNNKALPVYTDFAILHVKVQAKISQPVATLTDVPTNFAPTVNPSSYKTSTLTKWEWVPDPYGEINVTGITTDQVTEFPPDSVLRFYVTHKDAYVPGFKVTYTSTGAVAQFQQAVNFEGFPETFDIDFKTNDHSNVDNFSYTHTEGALGKWFYVTVFGH